MEYVLMTIQWKIRQISAAIIEKKHIEESSHEETIVIFKIKQIW